MNNEDWERVKMMRYGFSRWEREFDDKKEREPVVDFQEAGCAFSREEKLQWSCQT